MSNVADHLIPSMVVRLQHRVFKSLKQNACTNSETLRNVLPLPILEGPIHNPFWSAITWERDCQTQSYLRIGQRYLRMTQNPL